MRDGAVGVLVHAPQCEADLASDAEELDGGESLGDGSIERAVEEGSLGVDREDEVGASGRAGTRAGREGLDVAQEEGKDVGVVEETHGGHLALHRARVFSLVEQHALQREVLAARVRDLAREVDEREAPLPELTKQREASALHGHLLGGEHLSRGICQETPHETRGGAASRGRLHGARGRRATSRASANDIERRTAPDFSRRARPFIFGHVLGR